MVSFWTVCTTAFKLLYDKKCYKLKNSHPTNYLMILYALKLWTNNERHFHHVIQLYKNKEIDFVELYNNPTYIQHSQKMKPLRSMPITIHAPNTHGFHEFIIKEEQMEIWGKTIKLADFYNSPYIIVHPGQKHSINSFWENISKIDDQRIMIENMAGLDLNSNPMFGQYIEELKKINQKKPICFDFEKAIKAACYQKKEYKKFISECLNELRPFYFHISGGDSNTPIDEHTNLWESNFDCLWIKQQLKILSLKKNVSIVFETPKNNDDLSNDIKNINYFKNL